MSKQTQFQPQPEGVKTPRMLEVEKRIGRTLEEDYKTNYLDGRMGQKRLANRWGVARGQIFGNLRGGRRNWVQMLHLPKKGEKNTPKHSERSSHACEICGTTNIPLENAHWIAARDGCSSRADNILKLCPNCHTRLDQLKDENTTSRAREVLLLRAAESLLQSTSARGDQMQSRFLNMCRSIIERKHIERAGAER